MPGWQYLSGQIGGWSLNIKQPLADGSIACVGYAKNKLANPANPNNASSAIPFLSISYIMEQKLVFGKMGFKDC